MITTKYVNVETIMERAKKDLPPSIEINIEDVVEYVWEAITKIGARETYIVLYTILKVENYKTKLPDWMNELIQVRYLTSDTTLYGDDDALGTARLSGYYMDTVLDPFDLSRTTSNVGNSQGYRYILKDNYIHTTFEEGLIEIAYTAFPMDEQARPVIPENVYFIEAVKWYIIKQYLWRLVIRDTTMLSVFQYAEGQWNFYVNSAKSAAIIPNKDGLFTLMNKFLRVLPNYHRNFRYTYYNDPLVTSDELNNIIQY